MSEPPPQTPPGGDSAAGYLMAVAAYLIWGHMPLYLHALGDVPAAEIVAHRVIWSLPVAGAVVLAVRRTAELKAALWSPTMLAQAALTAFFVSANWGIYVWAIGTGRTLDAALGYYINPLFSVGLGAAFLGERLGRAQWLAIGLAGAAVALLTWDGGTLPWVALLLTLTWGLYAYFRKTLPIGPNQGFFLELLLLLPFALGYAVWLGATGQAHFLSGDPAQTWLLIGFGVMTGGPLVLYANGAKRLRLSTIGMLQYISPTAIFIIAVFVFREPFPPVKLAAFGLIWAAVAIFVAGTLAPRRAGSVRDG